MRWKRLAIAYFQVACWLGVELLLGARYVGVRLTMRPDALFWYLLLVGATCYPMTRSLEQAVTARLHLVGEPKGALRRHMEDVAAYDRGSNWRVAHTRVSYVTNVDFDRPSQLAMGLLRVLINFGWLLLSPLILIGILTYRMHKKSHFPRW